ncbi:MAG: hypothetical protein ACLFQ8_03415 [Candidatus Aenigmatarchaeota archaeon]
MDIVDKLKNRLEEEDYISKAALTGTCAKRVEGISYEMDEETDIDILLLCDIYKSEFKKMKNLDDNAAIIRIKDEIDGTLGPIDGCQVDSYTIFEDQGEDRFSEEFKRLNSLLVGVYEEDDTEEINELIGRTDCDYPLPRERAFLIYEKNNA